MKLGEQSGVIEGMEEKMYNFKRIGMNEIKELFINVFTIEPWNDDWSNQEQLDLYLFEKKLARKIFLQTGKL